MCNIMHKRELQANKNEFYALVSRLRKTRFYIILLNKKAFLVK